MQYLLDALKEHDMHLLQIIANRWDVDLDSNDPETRLAEVMLDSDAVNAEWDRLRDDERGALQMVLGTSDHCVPTAQFERVYGDIRQMGPDKRQREKPHLSPNGPGEVLYYRGFIHIGFAEGKTGTQRVVYVPPDLAAIMPISQTGFDPNAEPEDFPDDLPTNEVSNEIALETAPPHVERTDTSLVDDLTALLAYIQNHTITLETGYVPHQVRQDVLAQFIGPQYLDRLNMILYLGVDMGLIEQLDGQLHTVRHKVRVWLEANRVLQVKALVDAWYQSTAYNELWYTPGLMPETAGWQNDPRLIRRILLSTMEFMVSDQWVTADAIIEAIRDDDPDFQRPGGDYSSWYIRDAETGDYLQGFENWDRVEGAVLRYTIIGPMFWLGMLDLGATLPQNPPAAFKLSAFGRAWTRQIRWPQKPDPDTPLQLESDSRILVPRAASRYERFQIARFADWGPPVDPYVYTLSSASLKRANEQGIRPEHIRAFLQRTTGQQELPASIQALLGAWNESDEDAAIVLQRLLVLQVDTPERLRQIWETPEIRRFLGRQLGPTAVIVREDQWQALIAALEQLGIFVQTAL